MSHKCRNLLPLFLIRFRGVLVFWCFSVLESTLFHFFWWGFRACWGFSAGAKNEGFFRQFSRFWRSIAGTTWLKKGEKWRKKNRFGPGGKIPNMLLSRFAIQGVSGCWKQPAIVRQLFRQEAKYRELEGGRKEDKIKSPMDDLEVWNCILLLHPQANTAWTKSLPF